MRLRSSAILPECGSSVSGEHITRRLPVGRKKWTFARCDSGGQRAAVMYTIIETAKLDGLDAEAYLRALIDRIADHPAKQIDELLPGISRYNPAAAVVLFALQPALWVL